jgi:hypothetical protein
LGAEAPTAGGDRAAEESVATLTPGDAEAYDFLAPPQAPGDLGRLGPYRVLEVLGAGGMGVVFRAEDPLLKREVALKAMLPRLAAGVTARQRFLREAQAAAALKHDHVVTIFQVGEDRGAPFLAMELLEGESLDRRATREGRLPAGEVLRVGREVAEGLAAAHDRGLIHRDVKPANLWLEGKRGRVKILDFGLARAAGDEARLTQIGAIRGTPAYMAPEQAQGGPVGPACDLFSLGCVLYRLASGQPPFQGADTISTLVAVATVEPPSPRDLNPALPRELSDLVMKLLAKDPGRRGASAQEVVDAVRAIEAGLAAQLSGPLVMAEGGAARKRSASAARPSRRRRLWPVAAAGLVTVVLALGAYVAATALRAKADRGTLVGDVNDPDVLATAKQTAAVLSDSAKAPAGGDTTPAPDLSAFDRLRREDIPADRLTVAGHGDPEKAPKEIVAIFGDARAKVAAFALHPDGRTLAAVIGGRLRLIDLATGKQRGWPRNLRDARQLRFSHSGKLLALCASHDSLVPTALWDVAGGEQAQVIDNQAGNEESLAFSPDDRQVFWVRMGRPLRRVWVAGAAELGAPPPAALDGANYPMQAMALSPDGNVLAASSVTNYESAFIQLWDVRTGRVMGKTNDKMRGAFRLVFTPDSKRLAQVHAYVNEVPVFDVATRQRRGAFASHNTTDVCFDAKGTLAATCSWSGEVSLWDATTYANLRILRIRPPESGRESGGIRAVQFAPDGRHLLTRNHDGTLYVLRPAAPGAKSAAAPAP